MLSKCLLPEWDHIKALFLSKQEWINFSNVFSSEKAKDEPITKSILSLRDLEKVAS